MNQCPECKRFIHILMVKKMKGRLFIMEENKSVLEPENFEYCDDNKVIFNQFSCPKCDSLLFFDEFEAREFIDKV